MKILYLTPGVFDKGGISRYNRFQIRALRESFGAENIKVMSLMGREVGDLEEPFEVAYAGAMPLGRGARVLFASEAARVARSFRPDVVLCALVNLGPLALAIAKLVRARLVQNVYGLELWVEGGLSRVRRTALQRSHLVISDCHSTADQAVALGLRADKPSVVWDCVDVDRYTPAAPDWSSLARYGLERSDRFRVLFLGRIAADSRYKGFERMLELVARLPDRFEAVVAGKGNFVGELERQAESLGVGHRATFTGPIHEDDMPAIYRSADAFYLTSEVGPSQGEGIPLTPMEAMACGSPVVVGDQDGSRELLDGGGGWCGSPTDLDAQATYLVSLADDPAWHVSERQAATLRANDAFGYAAFAAETTRLLRALPRPGAA